MKIQLFKSILCCSFLLLLLLPSAFGQWSKKGKNAPELEDTPDFKITKNNLKDLRGSQLILSPFKLDMNISFNVSLYLEGKYQVNDQLSIGAYGGVSYWFNVEDFYFDYESTDLIKRPLQFGLQGEYTFIEKKKKKEYKMIVESASTGYREITHYYVPVIGKQFILTGARMGFNYYKIPSLVSFDRFNLEFDSEDHNEEALVNSDYGFIHLGVSRSIIDNIEADIEGFGKKEKKVSKYIFFDLLINTNVSFDAAVPIREDTFIPTEQLKTTPIGFRVGYRKTSYGKWGSSWGIETGIKPMPYSELEGQLRNSFYLSVYTGFSKLFSVK